MIKFLGQLRRTHHINCGVFRPWPHALLATHVLACEFEHGLVLVDSGLGTADMAKMRKRLGLATLTLRPPRQQNDALVNQLKTIGGWEISDVTAIVATHLDYDHIGGASDFVAPVYTTGVELAAATARKSTKHRVRYRPAHLSDLAGRLKVLAEPTESVLGMRVVPIDAGGAMFLVPMPGHTVGHSAVAVRDPHRGWLLHAGDAFFHRASIGAAAPDLQSRITEKAERLLAQDASAVKKNHEVLAQLASDSSDSSVRVFCSHDKQQFDILHGESTQPARRAAWGGTL